MMHLPSTNDATSNSSNPIDPATLVTPSPSRRPPRRKHSFARQRPYTRLPPPPYNRMLLPSIPERSVPLSDLVSVNEYIDEREGETLFDNKKKQGTLRLHTITSMLWMHQRKNTGMGGME